tara:strand:- start:1370 stop:1615 length:246 start_codon:yes stop_codon:yes gene_type:complete
MTYNMQTQSMGDKYQQVIDMIYHDCPNPPEGYMMTDWVDGAYFLACAIKECMTHQDGGDTGYMYEKISKALKRFGMTEVKA